MTQTRDLPEDQPWPDMKMPGYPPGLKTGYYFVQHANHPGDPWPVWFHGSSWWNFGGNLTPSQAAIDWIYVGPVVRPARRVMSKSLPCLVREDLA